MTEPQPPPRLLLGCALLLWGAVTGHPLVGLLLAVVAEGHGWTRIRWEFGELAMQRAWRLGLLVMLITAVVVWMDGAAMYAAPRTMVWLPLIGLPLLFVQNYGLATGMPLTAFSHLLKRRRLHAEAHGLPFREPRFHFGQVYFVLVLLGTALGEHSGHWVFFPATVGLSAWLLHHRFGRRPRIAPVGAAIVLAAGGTGGYYGAIVLEAAYQHFASGRGSGHERADWARHSHTSIGELGEIKQSPRIVWRLIPESGPLPDLVRVASYNLYRSTFWTAVVPPDVRTSTEDFTELNSFEREGTVHHVTARSGDRDFIDGSAASDPALPRFSIRGAVSRRDLLPLPAQAASVTVTANRLEMNSYGTLRIEPGQPVIHAGILWDSGMDTSRGPLDPEDDDATSADLRLPNPEHQPGDAGAVKRMVDRLGLRELPLDGKIRRLREEFNNHYTYSRYASLALPPASGRDFIRRFLEETRRGHCEYFATSTVFLLRECGVPARYATGFAVHERDRNGVALLRGTHAHAWALAWDEENRRWIDVDLTPPDWTGMETPRLPPWQHFLDRWQAMLDDFSIWRSDPGNLGLLAAVVATPLVAGGIFIFRRLWRSRRRLDPQKQRRFATPPSPLERVERAAARILGPRPVWQPLSGWLAPLADRLKDPGLLDEAIRLHRRLRFDPEAPKAGLESSLGEITRTLLREIRRIS